ncbi:DUF2721 domain-containing protein [Trichlorobacter ammonificans]|uniref:DUF2721 domain-containing protein n=1 Tax=Trichlorobacter ammonificans TaxID=2916410 RepID=A0ABN8HK18_9BACT|nr:DUF2721 domain-containing protein [Trichlorobacter ammonificans]CAH2031675.1 conserved membrane protein of unknown function [Trichlorobacter ammonificans]
MIVAAGDVHSVGHAIQLAVAPVFLLTGISGLLSVMTNRLGRVIDRARVLEQRVESATPEQEVVLRQHLQTLSYRASLIGRSIALCTTTAVLICSVVAMMFVGAFLGLDPSIVVGLFFIAAMVALVSGLLWFLREIFVATRSLHIGPQEDAAQRVIQGGGNW